MITSLTDRLRSDPPEQPVRVREAELDDRCALPGNASLTPRLGTT